jgi:transcriptional regulator with XRE-family HTH domain
MLERVSVRARERLRAEMRRREISQTALAARIGWTQSRLSKVLGKPTDLGVDDLAVLCAGVGLRLTETVRDQDLEFCAELTPSELRLVEYLRQRPPDYLDAILKVFILQAPERSGVHGKKSRHTHRPIP